MRAVALLVFLPVTAWGAPGSYTFGGFSPGEREYWKRGADDQLCGPPATCRPVDKKAVKGFVKPPRARRAGGVALNVVVDEDTRIRLVGVGGGGPAERDLGTFTPGGRVSSVNTNLFVAPGGELVAVEYEAADKGAKRTDVVVFDLAAGGAAPAPAAAQTPALATQPAPAGSPAAGKNAYDRALGQGGVWEQRLQACDQAGVTLSLKKTRKFDIKITTKCQGQKDVTTLAGAWTSEGNDTIVLGFENEDGPQESMVCRFATCPDGPDGNEDCLGCAQDDVVFTMRVVRR